MTDPYWQQYPQEPWPPNEPVPYPEDPKPPRWPWIVAAISVLVVLAIALTSFFIVSHRSQTAAPETVTVTPSTTWAGPGDFPTPTTTTTQPPPSTPPPPNPSTGVETTPTTTVAPPVPTTEAPQPVPTTGGGPGGSGGSAKNVTYSAGGSGPIPGSSIQTISVSYMTDETLVRVPNVTLPWAVSVTRKSTRLPYIMTVMGGDVSCTITVDGVVVSSVSVPDYLATCNA